MKNEKTVFTPPTFDYAEKRHMTATGKLLRNSNLNLDGLTQAERLSMQEVTQEALFELSTVFQAQALQRMKPHARLKVAIRNGDKAVCCKNCKLCACLLTCSRWLQITIRI